MQKSRQKFAEICRISRKIGAPSRIFMETCRKEVEHAALSFRSFSGENIPLTANRWHFAVSRDGFHWQALNGGHPVLWAYYGDRGVRDMTIVRDHASGKFHIFATDLSLSYGMRNQYQHSWRNIGLNGSRDLAHWVSDDLVHWSEEEMVRFGTDDMGCVWAPDVIFDSEHGEYLVHWSSKHRCNNFGNMAIYGSRTKDFRPLQRTGIDLPQAGRSISTRHVLRRMAILPFCEKQPEPGQLAAARQRPCEWKIRARGRLR